MKSNWKIRQAVKALKQGEVIAYPTEAVYGLGCDPWNEHAVQKLLTIKQRDWQKGLIIIAADFNQLQDFIATLPAKTLQLLEKSWPGPETWVLPVSTHVSDNVTGQHDTIAVRVTAHTQTVELCRAFGGAIISTSANITGLRAATTVKQVRWQLPEVTTVLSGSCVGSAQPTVIRNAQTGEKIR
ncbi:MAG: threonylcarbamoyl-AMP synthase [Gammaproteobacteria bacterium]|nr:MAG: threonylcarbamoyl-AMP synthase [Gammaproteobacteria bacterium]